MAEKTEDGRQKTGEGMGWNMVNVFDRGAGLCRIGGVGGFPPQAGLSTADSGPGRRVEDNFEGTERRLERLAKFTAEIAETGEEPRGVEITGCLLGEGVIYSIRVL